MLREYFSDPTNVDFWIGWLVGIISGFVIGRISKVRK